MKNLTEFHDGSFEGLWIAGKAASFFLGTSAGEHYAFHADGVAALRVDGVKAGNIIFEVLERSSEDITIEDIRGLYDLQSGPAGEAQGRTLWEGAKSGRKVILEINPSYGATVMVLACSLTLLRREEWLDQCSKTAKW